MAVSEVFLTHIGGVESVTGSCTLLTIKRGKDIKRILIDFGSYQEQKNLEKNYTIPYEINPSEIDAVILTHAHADHSGLLARLVKHGFNGEVYVSEDTPLILKLQLKKCSEIINKQTNRVKKLVAKIRKRKVRKVRKVKDYSKFSRKKEQMREIDELDEYQDGIDFSEGADITDEDVSKTESCIKAVKFGRNIEIFPGITLQFTFNNHMLGSSIVDITIDRDAGIPPTTIEFTGDLGRNEHMLYGSFKIPDIPKSNLVVVTEATYGNRNHMQTMEEAAEEFLQEIVDTIKNKGRVIIPAFALERTQLLVYILNKARAERQDEVGEILRSIPITIDSPSAIDFTKIYSDLWNPKRFSNTERNYFSLMGINCAYSHDDHIATLNNTEPGIILTTGGMGDIGRILDYYDIDLENAKSKILFCGYVPDDSLGRKVINAKQREEISVKGIIYKVSSKIKQILGLSSHADQRGLIAYIKSRIKRLQGLIIMHGDDDAKEALADELYSEGVLCKMLIPSNSNKYGCSCYEISATGAIKSLSYFDFESRITGKTLEKLYRGR